MPEQQTSHRVRTSDDLEVSAYLETRGRAEAFRRSDCHPGPCQPEAVVVIDFGSQFTHADRAADPRVPRLLRARAARHATWEQVAHLGRGASSSRADRPASMTTMRRSHPAWVFEQACRSSASVTACSVLAHQLGGTVAPSGEREYGSRRASGRSAMRRCSPASPSSMPVWMSHGDRIVELPPGFRSLAFSDNSPIAAMGNDPA